MENRLDELALGIGAVGDEPDGFAQRLQPLDDPADQLTGQLQLGAEGKMLAVPRRDLTEAFFPDVEQGAQRQADHTPAGVLHDPGDGDPDMAVEELLLGGSRRGVLW